MRKKGFTLIELLAVIIILGVISVIAVPRVNNYLKDSKMKTFKISIQNMMRAMKHEQAAQDYISLSYNFPLSSDATLELEGDTSDWEGIARIEENGKTIVAIYKDGYCGYKNKIENDVTIQKIGSKEECLSKIESGEIVQGNPLIPELIGQAGTSATTTEGFKDMGDGTYIYQGASGTVGTNYLWYGGHEWRIIKIDSNTNKLTLITAYPLTTLNWGSYTSSTDNCIISGTCSSLEKSYVGDWLNNVFIKSLPTKVQSKLEPMTYTRKVYNGSAIVEEELSNVKVRLLTEAEYTTYSGVDHYLDIKDYQWSADIHSSADVRHVNSDGTMTSVGPNSPRGTRPVVEVSNLNFQEGDGTLTNPYVVGNDKATTTENVEIGEYVSVPKADGSNYLARVVKQDEHGTKVILNGLYTTSAYGDSVTFSSTSTIYTGALTNFKNTLDPTYFDSKNKPFENTVYSSSVNYKDNLTYVSDINIGLPSIGEIFSGNDIDLGTGSKYFVDSTKIENPTLSGYSWSMNARNSTTIRSVNDRSSLSNHDAASTDGVRPTWYLPNVTITGGSGTVNNPYTLK